jgi:uncharacterized iron-regulated membrane protein
MKNTPRFSRTPPPVTPSTNPVANRYRTVWRWHFYAGVFCIPFLILLCTTGTLYLFKPQVEAWLDSDVNYLRYNQPPSAASLQVRTAVERHGGSFHLWELPPDESGASRIHLRHADRTELIYLHPAELQTLKQVNIENQFMNVVKRIHGELYLGDSGSIMVELAACWTLILLLTGIYLWWPRNTSGLAGVLYPRWWLGKRGLLRDLHAVTGIWISLLAMILILTGLPWAYAWGNYFRWLRTQTGTAVARQDWQAGSRASHEHADHQESKPTLTGTWQAEWDAIDRLVPLARRLSLAPPVQIQPPSAPGQPWTIRSQSQNRTLRSTYTIDSQRLAILKEERFRDRHWLDRLVGTGIALHEGQLFGLANQGLGVIATGGLMLLAVSGSWMWWRRRPAHSLGAPTIAVPPSRSWLLAGGLLGLGILMPAFGLSVIMVAIVEQALRAWAPCLANWLGLRGSDQAEQASP